MIALKNAPMRLESHQKGPAPCQKERKDNISRPISISLSKQGAIGAGFYCSKKEGKGAS